MSDVLVSEPPDHAKPFRAMADRIDLNREQGFGGSFVMISPDGDVHEMLLIDNSGNAAAFWGSVQTRIAIAISNIDQETRGAPAFGRTR